MDEVQRLLDQLVAAGAPGAAGWVEDERDSLRLLPGGGPGMPPPRSSGYSLPLGPPGQVADGPRDGRRQLGVMVNVLPAPDPVYEAFIKGLQALGVRLRSGERH
jgi:hypothetical protein